MGAARSCGRKGDAAPIRLMIVDDSIVARSVFETILAPHPRFEVVATASTATQALELLADCPVDIVLLDLAMPGMDGFEALPEIIARGQGARVLIVSASAGQGADACVRALTLGAADTLEKPSAGAFRDRFGQDLVEKLLRIGGEGHAAADGRVGRTREDATPAPATPLRDPVEGPVGCLAIGSSTGGLHALSEFFGTLPPTCAMPILITQHLPESFMPYFARQMAEIAGRPATVAEDGVPLLPGRILVAPGDAHIGLRSVGGRARVRLGRNPVPSGCLPSVDPMLEGVASLFGEAGYAVILTGMGRDGTIGARAIADGGGEIAAQDPASSVVWGMPGSVASAGLASMVAPPAAIARRIADRMRECDARPWR